MKYIVALRTVEGWWKPITRGTTRPNAHALAAKLGPKYAVVNTWTRRESIADQG